MNQPDNSVPTKMPTKSADDIPAWVRSGALACHSPAENPILFVIGHVIKSPTGQIYLCDYPRNSNGIKYLLTECELGTPQHFRSIALFSINGTIISVVRDRERNEMTLAADGHLSRKIGKFKDPTIFEDPELIRATDSLARFFGGMAGAIEEVE